jgi:hypothetical protein
MKSKNNILMYTEFITSTEVAWQWLQGAENVIIEWRTPSRPRDISRERFTINCDYLHECWGYICTTKLNSFQELLQFTAREGCFSGNDIPLLPSLRLEKYRGVMRMVWSFYFGHKPCWNSRAILILDGHYSHTNNLEVINRARKSYVTALCLPPHSALKLQSLYTKHLWRRWNIITARKWERSCRKLTYLNTFWCARTVRQSIF